MKPLFLLIFLASFAWAGPWVPPSQRENYMRRVLPFIENPEARLQAERAMQAFTEAEHPDQVAKALSELSETNAPAAKIAALYYSIDPTERERLSASVHLELHDLPLVISWMVTNGMTNQNLFSTTDSSVKGERLDVLAGKVNAILSSQIVPLHRGHESGNGWGAYMPEELRLWALEQVQWALKNKVWNSEDTDFLTRLSSKLKSVAIPQLNENSGLIDFVPQPTTGSEQNKYAKPSVSPNHDGPSSPAPRIDKSWLVWLVVVIAATVGAVWVFLRKSK